MLATFMGYQFGAKGTRSNPGAGRYGRFFGAAIGLATSLAGMAYVDGQKLLTGEDWVPERRIKEREVTEYFDNLKYVKSRSLYEYYAQRAMKEEGFNVEAYMNKKGNDGAGNKERLHQLQQAKRDLKLRHDRASAVSLVGDQGDEKSLMKALNKEINGIQNDRKAHEIPALAAQAIMYHNESENTLYGYDAGEPIANLLAALPKKDRDYFSKFLNAPEEERKRILAVVPEYMRRPLQSAWGMQVDEKPSLEEYFKDRYLPDADWVGWDPRANLDSIKVKFVKREGLDMSEFNIWMDDEKEAAPVRDDVVPVSMNVSEKAAVVRNKLRDILGEAGVENLDIQVNPSPKHGVNMDIRMKQDRRADVIQQMNENGYSLV